MKHGCDAYHGFAASDITLDKPVHLVTALCIRDDIFQRFLLCVGKFEREDLVQKPFQVAPFFFKNGVVEHTAGYFLLNLFCDAQHQLDKQEFFEYEAFARMGQLLLAFGEVNGP